MKLDLQEIETFLRVVELGGVSRAAEDLGLSKSVVSKRLSDLEQRLGARLLHRSTRKVSATENGLGFYQQARDALGLLRQAAEAASLTDNSLRGRLRMLSPMSFGTLWLAPLIAEFMGLHPELEINLQLDDRVGDFEREGFDLCIRISHIEDSALIARQLGRSSRVLCCSPAYLAKYGMPQRIEDLAAHDCIGYSNVASARFWSFDGDEALPQQPSIAPQGRFASNNGEVMCAMALGGQGLALLPRFIAHRYLNEGSLVQVLPQASPRDYGIYALYPRSSRGLNKVLAICDFLQQRLADPPWEQAWSGPR